MFSTAEIIYQADNNFFIASSEPLPSSSATDSFAGSFARLLLFYPNILGCQQIMEAFHTEVRSAVGPGLGTIRLTGRLNSGRLPAPFGKCMPGSAASLECLHLDRFSIWLSQAQDAGGPQITRQACCWE